MRKIYFLLAILCMGVSFASAQNSTETDPLITASFGKGIILNPADKSFSMKVNLRIQNLATFSQQLESQDPADIAFMVRRARFKAGGFILSPKLKYKVELGLTNRDIESTQRGDDTDNPGPILDMVLRWNFTGNWELGFGQTKLPGNRERLVSSANLQMVDRSIVNSKFTTDRDAGFWLGHHLGKKVIWRNTIAVTTGEGKNRSTGKNPNISQGGLAYSYRTEILPLGKFANKGEYFQGDIARESTPKLAVAFAYSYNDGAERTEGQLGKYFLGDETRDLQTYYVDYIFKFQGFSATGEYARRDVDNPVTYDKDNPEASAVYSYKGQGISSQLAYLFKNNVEVAGRFSYLEPHKDIQDFKDPQQDITLGISKYIKGHKLKVQADVTHSTSGGEQTMGARLQVETQF